MSETRRNLTVTLAVCLVGATHSPNDVVEESPVVDSAPGAGTPEFFRSVQSLTLQDQLVAEKESNSLIVEQPLGVQPIREFLEPLDGADESERAIAHDAAQEFMNGVPADWYLRWRPLSLDPLSIFVDRSIRLGDGPSREPVPYIRVSPFHSLSFVAKNTKFEDNGSTAAWVGDITEGGSGSVTITMAHETVDKVGVLIHIVSDHGNFNVAPTGIFPYYVVAEANPHARVTID